MRDIAPEFALDAGAGGGVRMPVRHFLFLQGLPGPFFRRLGARLRAEGAEVSRVNLNAGDLLDWPGQGTRMYSGRAEDWPGWLASHVRDLGVTDIVLFGDCRDAHRAAHLLADREGLRFHAFEEGYLRPDHVTLERGRVNGQSSFPRSLRALKLLVERLPEPSPIASSPSHFFNRARLTIAHYTAERVGAPLFPHYRPHRPLPPWREAWGWIRRRLRARAETAASNRAAAAIAGHPFFLLPLQIEGDTQLGHHSPFVTMQGAMEHIVERFAAAPGDAMLLVKRHPLDPGILDWRALVAAVAGRAGIADRVAFVERYDLMSLLRDARGVVTVNSTVGPLALNEGTPVMALGNAIYRVPGLTAAGTLEDFWHDPGTVDAGNLDLFRRALRAKALVNGCFHSKDGLARLIETSAERLMRS